LYFLRDRRGKSAKIKEKRGGEDLEAIYSTTTTAILDEPIATPVAVESPVAVETPTEEAPVAEAAEEATKTE
jgi:hypothetical protein